MTDWLTLTAGNSEGFSCRAEGNPKFCDVVTEIVYICQRKSDISFQTIKYVSGDNFRYEFSLLQIIAVSDSMYVLNYCHYHYY
jgi:hypothetical protein